MEKNKKEAKTFPLKKLTGFFKKSYTQKKFDKILKKIYIPEDKEKIQSLFSEKYQKGNKELLRIPRDKTFTKKELVQLKTLAKNIKANKGRIKLLPFIAVVAFIAIIGIAVTVFKNPVTKWGIRSGMQGIFGAKCDIGSVNVEIFGMLDLNFNLTDLLRAKFHAENIEITGIALGTERKTSGELPVKPKSAQEKEEKNDSTGFYDALKAKTGVAGDNAKDSILQKLAEYNPETIMNNINENLQTKTVAAEVSEDVKKIVESWKEKPAEIQNNVNEFKTNAEKLSKLNASSLKTPSDIKNAISDIQNAMAAGEKLKGGVDTTLSSFEADSKKVEGFKTKLQDAVKADTDMVKNALPDLSVDGAKGFLLDTFDSFAYDMLGKYYPYLKKAVS